VNYIRRLRNRERTLRELDAAYRRGVIAGVAIGTAACAGAWALANYMGGF
jgi:hypothetical protein